jgi:hypothetical protein
MIHKYIVIAGVAEIVRPMETHKSQTGERKVTSAGFFGVDPLGLIFTFGESVTLCGLGPAKGG